MPSKALAIRIEMMVEQVLELSFFICLLLLLLPTILERVRESDDKVCGYKRVKKRELEKSVDSTHFARENDFDLLILNVHFEIRDDQIYAS